jgi:hypothetical protein
MKNLHCPLYHNETEFSTPVRLLTNKKYMESMGILYKKTALGSRKMPPESDFFV